MHQRRSWCDISLSKQLYLFRKSMRSLKWENNRSYYATWTKLYMKLNKTNMRIDMLDRMRFLFNTIWNQAWIVLQWVNISLHDQINIFINMILVLSVIKRCLITFKWLHLFIEFRQFNRNMFRSLNGCAIIKWYSFSLHQQVFFSFLSSSNWIELE